MRKRFDAQIGLGQTPIENVILPLRSRDELPPVLAGLQWIFKTPEVNGEIFELLEEKISGGKQDTGRPGMDLWHVLVLGVVRLALGCDYDRIEHVANYDGLVRQIMGLPSFGGEEHFHHKTISDNICHIDAGVLGEINAIVVRHGRETLKKNGGSKGEEKLEVKTDSYVLESNVHYPTDCNLLWDAARKCVELLGQLHEKLDLPGWRKAKHWKKRVKNAMRACEQAASGGGANKAQRVLETARDYLGKAYELEEKVNGCIAGLRAMPMGVSMSESLGRIGYFHDMLIMHIDLVERRLVQKETIPHGEKTFSLFEPHTELIKKGKTMPPVEFGHRLLVSTEQYGLVIDYKIMFGGSEGAEIVPVADRLLDRFGEGAIGSLSTDKGFSSKADRELIELYIPEVIMPKKGRRSAADTERESTKRWKRLKGRHSAVESDINCLEQHGLDRCPDKGLGGYERYVGLGILAYNLHKIGAGLLAEARAAATRGRKPRLGKKAA
jgi:IS5 family transposase